MKFNHRLLFQVGLFSCFGMAIWQFGFKLATLESPSQFSESPVAQSETVTAVPQTPPLLKPKSSVAERGLAEASQEKSQINLSEKQIHPLISKNGLERKRNVLAKAFRVNEIGSRLADVATLFQFRIRAGTEESTYLNEQLKYLENRPSEAFEELKYGMAQLGPEFNRERRFFVEWVSRLPGDAGAKTEFFSNEIKRAAKDLDPSHQSYFNGITALNAMFKVTNDSGVVETALREALKSPVEPNTEFFLMAAYEERDPQRALKLKEDLRR